MAGLILTDQNFKEEVIETKTPVLVDFWASWCGPCKIQNPIIEELAKEYKGKDIKIAKFNVEENPQTPSQFQVMSIPTLMIFNGGKPVDTMIGVHEKEVLKKKLDILIK